MRDLVSLAVRRRVSVIMSALAVVAFGAVAYQRLAIELFPDITHPSITVQTDFEDTAPQEIETLISRPVEEAVGVLRGLKTIRSVSRPGVSEVTLEFEWGSDIDLLSMEVREKLDRLILPEGSDDPIILRFDPSLEPVVRLALHGEGSLVTMRRLAEKQIKQDFETLGGVAAAEIKGGLEDEVQIEVNQERLAALNIPIARIEQVVGVSNVNLPGGALRGQTNQYLVRTINEFDNVEEIGDLIIAMNEAAAVRLRDVATVRMGVKDREEITRVNGEESVEIAIYKEGDANTVTVARELHANIAEWQNGKLPPGMRMSVLFDQSSFIESAVKEVRNAAVIGGVLAILVLLFFLRDFTATLIIAISIPLSVIATFVAMYRMDISLNIMSLGGLTLGIGMLVDSSIVVLESIHRARQRGLPAMQAAIEGTTEVGAAVVASTLTTIAVFLPIVFVEGIAGQLFGDQALTVTFSMLASLLVAVTVIPMFSAMGGRRVEVVDEVQSLGRVSRIYDRLIGTALRTPVPVLLFGFALFSASAFAISRHATELIPTLTEGEFFFEVQMPEGTAITATNAVIEEMEEAAAADPRLALHYATVGSRVVSGGLSLQTKSENLGQLNLVLADRKDETAEAAVIAGLRERFIDIPELELELGRPSYFSMKTPIEVIIFGEDLELLRAWSLQLAEAMSGIAGLRDVRSSLEAGNPELQVIFDRNRLAAMGLDLGQMSSTLRTRVQGSVPTRFKEEDRQIDIRVRNAGITESSQDDVRRLVLPGPEGPIRLISVADVRLDRGPAEIHRVQQQRAAVVSADLQGRSLGAAVVDVRALLAAMPPPPGLSIELGGQNEEMETSFASIRFAIILAIFLVYLVMASTFESFLHPLLVLFTIPLALVGVYLGLWITQTTISVIVLIGVIMLVGIVVNNAIVLIDTINRYRRGGMAKAEAIVRAGHVRLRPILMTTLTTVLGLLPMALSWGEGAELRAPLAITVASGLLLSTLLTLVVIPAAYALVPSSVSSLEEEA
ncbi:AcrB/AcrD/AcrF family protein [bacterium]|nr:MAG: AcrB/AcrD/AcrF family protein [bacterium]